MINQKIYSTSFIFPFLDRIKRLNLLIYNESIESDFLDYFKLENIEIYKKLLNNSVTVFLNYFYDHSDNISESIPDVYKDYESFDIYYFRDVFENDVLKNRFQMNYNQYYSKISDYYKLVKIEINSLNNDSLNEYFNTLESELIELNQLVKSIYFSNN